jgi:hypothetical protein
VCPLSILTRYSAHNPSCVLLARGIHHSPPANVDPGRAHTLPFPTMPWPGVASCLVSLTGKRAGLSVSVVDQGGVSANPIRENTGAEVCGLTLASLTQMMAMLVPMILVAIAGVVYTQF